MQKKINIIMLLLAAVCFQHCKKANLNESPNFSNFQKVSLKDSAQAWLQVQKTTPSNFKFIDTLQQKIAWDSLTVVIDTYHEQKILYVPVNYNNNHTGLVFAIDDKTASVSDGYFLEIPSSYPAASPVQFLSTFYLHTKNSLTAKITAYDLSSSFSFGLGYEKGEYKYKKIPEKVAVNTNRQTTASNSSSRFDCKEYYLVTYYSDGSQDREYIGTVCNNCEQTRIISNNARNAYSLRCDGPGSAGGEPGGGSGAGGGSGSGSSSTIYKNAFSWPSSAKAVITKIDGTNSSFHSNVINTGLFILANVSVNYDFDLVSRTLDSKSVTTYIEDGMVIGAWTQSGVTTVYTYGDKMYFTINGFTTTSIPNIPFPIITSYTIKVEHNLQTNIVKFDNVSSSSQGLTHGNGIEND